jgi:hypothetical protein
MVIVAGACGVLGRDVRYAAELNRLPVGCRRIAMGNADAALSGAALAATHNPALGAFDERRTLHVEGARLYGGLSDFGAASVATPVQSGLAAGLYYAGLLSGSIPQYDSLPGSEEQRLYSGKREYPPTGVFENNHHTAALSVAKSFSLPVPRPGGFTAPLPVDLGIGVTFKYHWQTMTANNAVRMGMNVNMDAGAALRIGVDYDLRRQAVSRELLLGLGVQDVLPTRVVWLHSYENYQERVDRTIYTGASYADRSGMFWADWTISVGVHRQYESTLHAGIEAMLWKRLALRVGLSDGAPSFGAGIITRYVTVDYACSFDAIDATPLRIALTVTL